MHLCLGIQETIYLLFHYASLHSGKDKWTIWLQQYNMNMVYMHLLNQGRSNNFIDILNCFQDTFNATIINFIISLNKYFTI